MNGQRIKADDGREDAARSNSPESQFDLPLNSKSNSDANIFAVDIGGTFIKASVIDENGVMITPWLRMPTPKEAMPHAVIDCMHNLAQSLPEFGRISIAFPGVVRQGCIVTAPNLGNEYWLDFQFRDAIRHSFRRDVRVLNDAVVQGLGVAHGLGLECILTFGTGLGFALFRDACFLVQLEIGQHLASDYLSYDRYVGHAAYVAEGHRMWNARVERTLAAMRGLVNFDHLYLGGGNSRRIEFDLPDDVSLIPVTAGITGGARLWAPDAEVFFKASG